MSPIEQHPDEAPVSEEAHEHAEEAHEHAGASHEDHHGHDKGFLRKYVFSLDHKVIGIQYGITALLFLAIGFYLMMVMRWSIAYPQEPLPGWMSWVFSEEWKARWLQDGKVTGMTYNMFGMPLEGSGVSGPPPRGRPRFEDAKFVVEEGGDYTFAITMRYLGGGK